jgi:hypothetical protein
MDGLKDSKLNYAGTRDAAESTGKHIINNLLIKELKNTTDKNKPLLKAFNSFLRNKSLPQIKANENEIQDSLPILQALSYLFQASRVTGAKDMEDIFKMAAIDRNISKRVISDITNAFDIIKSEVETNKEVKRKF